MRKETKVDFPVVFFGQNENCQAEFFESFKALSEFSVMIDGQETKVLVRSLCCSDDFRDQRITTVELASGLMFVLSVDLTGEVSIEELMESVFRSIVRLDEI